MEGLKQIEIVSLTVNIDVDLALKSGEAYPELRDKAVEEGKSEPSLFDTLTLAAARRYEVKVLTGDEHFKRLKETE